LVAHNVRGRTENLIDKKENQSTDRDEKQVRSLFKSKTELTIVRNKVFAMAEPWHNHHSTMPTTNHSLANRSQFMNHPWSNHCKIFVLQSRKYVASFLPQIISKKLI
jgi:hypothetical protein